MTRDLAFYEQAARLISPGAFRHLTPTAQSFRGSDHEDVGAAGPALVAGAQPVSGVRIVFMPDTDYYDVILVRTPDGILASIVNLGATAVLPFDVGGEPIAWRYVDEKLRGTISDLPAWALTALVNRAQDALAELMDLRHAD